MTNYEQLAQELEKCATIVQNMDLLYVTKANLMDGYIQSAAAIRELCGALSAQDRMQNEQLDKHRDTEILALPECVVASSDVVDDLIEHFYGLLCDRQKQIAELRSEGQIEILVPWGKD